MCYLFLLYYPYWFNAPKIFPEEKNFGFPYCIIFSSFLLHQIQIFFQHTVLKHVQSFPYLTFRGPCIVSTFQYISNKMQLHTVYLYLETALHVSCGISTHQEHTQLYLQHLVLVKPLLLPAAIMEDLELQLAAGSSYGLTSTRYCGYSCVCSC